LKGHRQPRVLHLYDAADVGATIVRYGRRTGLPWRQFNVAPPEGGAKVIRSAVWQARRASGILAADLLHLHSGSRIGIVRSKPYKPFVLHFHGTDIRTQYYDPLRRPTLQWGADNAAAVLYSTPDLEPHARTARADAVYLPNPVAMDELPAWDPRSRPLVVFASRWESSKGGSRQLELARKLAAALGPFAELQGIDWGSESAAAAALGVELVPRMPKDSYLAWLASAHCVIGQSAGILAMSELQAVALGVPVAMPKLGNGYYPEPVPVLQGEDEELVEQVRHVLHDPVAASAQLSGPQWIRHHHAPEQAVNTLVSLYDRLYQERGGPADRGR
jgi:hypothetical protein